MPWKLRVLLAYIVELSFLLLLLVRLRQNNLVRCHCCRSTTSFSLHKQANHWSDQGQEVVVAKADEAYDVTGATEANKAEAVDEAAKAKAN
jgi:hypothetical protein